MPTRGRGAAGLTDLARLHLVVRRASVHADGRDADGPGAVADGREDIRVVGLDKVPLLAVGDDLHQVGQNVPRHLLALTQLEQRPDVVLALLLRLSVNLPLRRAFDVVGPGGAERPW